MPEIDGQRQRARHYQEGNRYPAPLRVAYEGAPLRRRQRQPRPAKRRDILQNGGERRPLRQSERYQQRQKRGGTARGSPAFAAAALADAGPRQRPAVCNPRPLDRARERGGRRRRRVIRALIIVMMMGEMMISAAARAAPHRHEQRPQSKRADYQIGGFLSGEGERQERGREIEPADAPLVEIPPHAGDKPQRPHRHQNVVARESAEIQHRRRESQHRRRQQRAEPPKPRPEQKRRPD